MAGSVDYLIDVDRETGELISGWPRIRQSIWTILTTRLRTRLMRLWWGSEFMDMQDKPSTHGTIERSIVAAIEAINLYEPEFKVTRVTVTGMGPEGGAVIEVFGDDLIEKASRKISVPF